MKLTTALAIATLGLAGTACSEAKTADDTAPAAQTDTVTVEDEYAGTMNLNLGGVGTEDETSPGTFNLNVSGSDDGDGLIIGADSYGGGTFEDAPALEIDLPDEEDDAPVTVPDEDDDIIRLPK